MANVATPLLNSLNWSTEALELVGSASLVAGTMVAILLVAQRVLGRERGRRLNPRFLHAIWVLVLFRFALVVVPASPTSFQNLWTESPSQPVVHAPELVELASISPDIFRQAELFDPSEVVADVQRPAFPVQENPLEAGPSSTTPSIPVPAISFPAISLWQGLAVCWLVGILFFLIRVLVQARTLAKWVRAASADLPPRVARLFELATIEVGNRPAKLRICDEIAVPSVTGIRNPTVLIPTWCLQQLDDEQLRMVLVHELIHVKRNDVLFQLVSYLIAMVHWFNPLSWMAREKVEAFRELTCDQRVLGGASDRTSRLYGKAILVIAEHCKQNKETLGMMPKFIGRNRNLTIERIQMLNRNQSGSRWATNLAVLGGVLLVAIGFTSAQEKQHLPNSKVEVAESAETVAVETTAKAARPFKDIERAHLRCRVFRGDAQIIDQFLSDFKSKKPAAMTPFNENAPIRETISNRPDPQIVETLVRQKRDLLLKSLAEAGINPMCDAVLTSKLNGQMRLHVGEQTTFLAPLSNKELGRKFDTGIVLNIRPVWTDQELSLQTTFEQAEPAGDLIDNAGTPGFRVRRTHTAFTLKQLSESALISFAANDSEDESGTKKIRTVLIMSIDGQADTETERTGLSSDASSDSETKPTKNWVKKFPVQVSETSPTGEFDLRETPADLYLYDVEFFRGNATAVAKLLERVKGQNWSSFSQTLELGNIDGALYKKFKDELVGSGVVLLDHPVLVIGADRPGEFLSGGEIPIPNDGGAIEFATFGLQLTLTPKKKDDHVIAYVDLKNTDFFSKNAKNGRIGKHSDLVSTGIQVAFRSDPNEAMLIINQENTSGEDTDGQNVMLMVVTRKASFTVSGSGTAIKPHPRTVR